VPRRRGALMGIDLGTTALKVGLFDAATGAVLAVCADEYQTVSPAPGWIELDAEVYWQATVSATRKALAEADGVEVLGIGLSSQGQTFILLDRAKRPLRPAIVWLDTRAEEQAGQLRSYFDAEEYTRRTGLLFPSVVDSSAKLLWLRENEPEVWAETKYIVLLPDYLGLRMTGQSRLDVNNAGSTGLLDMQAADWWPQALEAVGVPEAWLSPIGYPGDLLGTALSEPAQELGITEGIPVALGSNDHFNGAVGVGNVRPGMASGTVGTAMAIVCSVTEDCLEWATGVMRSRHPVPPLWTLLAYAKTSANLLTWLRDVMAVDLAYEELLDEASHVPAGADGLVCLPHFSGTATPTFRSDVRGGFIGMTLSHRRGHLVRAIAEAVCFEARDVMALVSRTGQAPNQLRMLGGATRSEFWMQMLADVVGLPLEIPVCTEAPVLGGAIFAGVAAGLFESIPEASQAFYRTDRTYLPQERLTATYEEGYARYRLAMEQLYPGALEAG